MVTSSSIFTGATEGLDIKKVSKRKYTGTEFHYAAVQAQRESSN